MKQIKDRDWDLALNITSDWEDLEEGLYTFNTFGNTSEAEAVEFAKHLGKCVCGEFMDKLRDELNRRAE